MATYRILGDQEMYVAAIDKIVPPGETFDLEDDVARDMAFAPSLYEVVTEPAPLPTPDEPKRNASADDWRAYALDKGADPDRVAELGRDELIAEFGENGD